MCVVFFLYNMCSNTCYEGEEGGPRAKHTGTSHCHNVRLVHSKTLQSQSDDVIMHRLVHFGGVLHHCKVREWVGGACGVREVILVCHSRKLHPPDGDLYQGVESRGKHRPREQYSVSREVREGLEIGEYCD